MRKGFTLFELVLALSIFGLILSMTSVSFLELRPKYELRKAVWEIQTCMYCARYRAIFEGKKQRITFIDDGYKIESNDNFNGWEEQVRGRLEGVRIEANNSPIFHPAGTVSSLASIYVSNSWGKFKITLAISGRIKATQL